MRETMGTLITPKQTALSFSDGELLRPMGSDVNRFKARGI